MRKGYGSHFLFNSNGELMGVCTGADATAEHMQGIAPIRRAICREDAYLTGLGAARYPEIPMPRLLDANRVTTLAEAFMLTEFANEPKPNSSDVYLSYGATSLQRYADELRLVSRGGEDPNISAAWDSKRFAIRVSGANYGEHIRDLARCLVKGEVVLGGEFVRDLPLVSGIVLLIPSRFDATRTMAAAEAQAAYETRMRAQVSSSLRSHGPRRDRAVGDSTAATLTPSA